MLRLKLPVDCQDYSRVLDSCCDLIKISDPLKIKIQQNKDALVRISNSYTRWARANFLFKYQYLILPDDGSPIKMGNNIATQLLDSANMKQLYSTYFVGKRCSDYYDMLINNAKDPKIQCPYCGGIGEPNELDHFLPKSKFAYYAIFPYNLVPVCKDCNQKYKKEFYPIEKNKQLIHPYLDNDCFFNEQWLSAEYMLNGGDIKFYPTPPDKWSQDKKAKVMFHFRFFELDRRFSIRSTSDLVDLVEEIKYRKKKNGNPRDFIDDRLNVVINNSKYCKNYWKVVLYQAIRDKIDKIWNVL
ncbi:HNH endonuclease [Lonepinella sp. MS14437]|uniref:HNH endonuclease n=1 Tax=Lonepinella sp. MS14437 TaxID=3003620 RepID=UPI0036D95364